ncbi:MAG: hypothetical protein CMM47_02575 [Rhodospirillaceae bacterium]|nr:hypothetical protein [Rhodospirillaceae bacterium]
MPLLGPSDPPPFFELNTDGVSDILFTSDHNGARVPAALDGLGVAQHEMRRHVAYDIGIDAVARDLSERFEAPLIASNYSRLVIDCNRHPDTAGSIPVVSDYTVVPANCDLMASQRAEREREIFAPYHKAIGARINAIRGRGSDYAPIVIALHSFTPVIEGTFRPWDIGILWKDDQRLAAPMIEVLARDTTINVGDNKPYSGSNPAGFTVDHHVEPLDLLAIGVEFRQDRIEFQSGAERWAKCFGDALEQVLAARPWDKRKVT